MKLQQPVMDNEPGEVIVICATGLLVTMLAPLFKIRLGVVKLQVPQLTPVPTTLIPVVLVTVN